MRILVMGAGAIGAYFGARLQAAGEQVCFCARGDNLRAMREHGLSVKSIRGDLELEVTATDAPSEFAPYDLILFCVKSYDSEAAARQIDGCLAHGGAVLSLQNGVEYEDVLMDFFPPEAIMAGNARAGVELVAPGKVRHLSTGVIEFGELDGRVTARARMFAEVFQRAAILGELSTRIRADKWDKLIWNAAFNTVTTLTRRTVGEIVDDPESEALLRRLMNEVIAVARVAGVELGGDRVEHYFAHSRKNLRALKTSTLQDLERGKRLEYEALAGAVVRAARRHGVAVPAMETVYALLKLLDGGLARA